MRVFILSYILTIFREHEKSSAYIAKWLLRQEHLFEYNLKMVHQLLELPNSNSLQVISWLKSFSVGEDQSFFVSMLVAEESPAVKILMVSS